MTQIHLHAEAGDYAPVVLLPGDPNRATRMAARFDGGLEATRQVNANRGLLGYTGTLGGVPVSVQTTAMGTPTTSIVMEELINLGVTTFIRQAAGDEAKHFPFVLDGEDKTVAETVDEAAGSSEATNRPPRPRTSRSSRRWRMRVAPPG